MLSWCIAWGKTAHTTQPTSLPHTHFGRGHNWIFLRDNVPSGRNLGKVNFSFVCFFHVDVQQQQNNSNKFVCAYLMQPPLLNTSDWRFSPPILGDKFLTAENFKCAWNYFVCFPHTAAYGPCAVNPVLPCTFQRYLSTCLKPRPLPSPLIPVWQAYSRAGLPGVPTMMTPPQTQGKHLGITTLFISESITWKIKPVKGTPPPIPASSQPPSPWWPHTIVQPLRHRVTSKAKPLQFLHTVQQKWTYFSGGVRHDFEGMWSTRSRLISVRQHGFVDALYYTQKISKIPLRYLPNQFHFFFTCHGIYIFGWTGSKVCQWFTQPISVMRNVWCIINLNEVKFPLMRVNWD